MNRFTVVWWPKAQDDLAALWLRAARRQLITADADELEQHLRESPTECGEESDGGIYRVDLRAIRVYFRVSELDRLVEVLGVAATQPFESG